MSALAKEGGRVAILGGYTTYGQQIAHYLSKSRAVLRLLVAGRDVQQAARAVHKLNTSKAQWAEADVSSLVNFRKFLYLDRPNVVINTERDQEAEISKICVDMGVHYVDLTDSMQQMEAERLPQFHEELEELCSTNNVLCVSNAAVNPGFTSAIISDLASNFQEVQSVDVYIAPDEGLAQDVFQGVGRDGGFRNLKKHENSYFGQIPEPVVDQMATNLGIPNINCYYSFHSRTLTGILQMASYFPGLDKDRIYEQISSHTSFLENQTPGLKIIVSGVNHQGEVEEKSWTDTTYPHITPAALSSIPAVMLTQKLLEEEMETGRVVPCISLFTFADVETTFQTIQSYDDEETTYLFSQDFQITEEEHFKDRVYFLVSWLSVAREVLQYMQPQAQAN